MTNDEHRATIQRLADAAGRRRRPVVALAVWVLTAATSVAQLLHPALLDQFQRNATALAAGEWWRMITPLFFQDGWLLGTIFNLIALAVIGIPAERLLGPWRWALIYFGCGLFGVAMCYLWLDPTGAGNSMAIAGLLGALATAVLMANRRYGITVPRPMRIAAGLIPLLAILDTVVHDNHGMPALLGMALGAALLPHANRAAPGTGEPATPN